MRKHPGLAWPSHHHTCRKSSLRNTGGRDTNQEAMTGFRGSGTKFGFFFVSRRQAPLTRVCIREPGRISHWGLLLSRTAPPAGRLICVRAGSPVCLRRLGLGVSAQDSFAPGSCCLYDERHRPCMTKYDVDRSCHVALLRLCYLWVPLVDATPTTSDVPDLLGPLFGRRPLILRGGRKRILPESNPALFAVQLSDIGFYQVPCAILGHNTCQQQHSCHYYFMNMV